MFLLAFILVYFISLVRIHYNKINVKCYRAIYFILFYIIADVQTVKINEISLNVK